MRLSNRSPMEMTRRNETAERERTVTRHPPTLPQFVRIRLKDLEAFLESGSTTKEVVRGRSRGKRLFSVDSIRSFLEKQMKVANVATTKEVV